MRVRQFLVIILVAFAAASAIAALTTIRQVRLEASGRHLSELWNAPAKSLAHGTVRSPANPL
jgi:hypothetical protein